VTSCIACPDGDEHEADVEEGWRCCRRARDRMAAALRDIPERCEELSGLGYVERDTRVGTRAVREGRLIVRVPAMADPAANLWPAGPTNGQSSQPRVGGSALPSVPIRIDPTDLLAPARPASLVVVDVGLYASDQVGHLAVATELEFWARDWAGQRRERSPMPTVRVLARWLLDRLDWACAEHPALDEFATKLGQLRNTLTAACGAFDPLPTPVDRPCPACGWWALSRPPDGAYIECGHCSRVLTDEDYRDHLEDVIKTNWTRYDAGDRTTRPLPTTPVWVRDDAMGHVTIGYLTDGRWRSWFGPELLGVSYWAEMAKPADPGPAKEDAA
jgi:hypothetical protein